jgi:membrane-associated phospholipid phosphatase
MRSTSNAAARTVALALCVAGILGPRIAGGQETDADYLTASRLVADGALAAGFLVERSLIPEPSVSGPGGAGGTFLAGRGLDAPTWNGFSDVLRLGTIGGPGLYYLSDGLAGDARERNRFLAWAESVLWTNLLTNLVKKATGKERPDGSDALSFPSGHVSSTSASVFYTAFDLYDRARRDEGWSDGEAFAATVAPALVLAAAMGVARMGADKHDLIDALGGMALGAGVAALHYEWRVDRDEYREAGIASASGAGPPLAIPLVRIRF